MTPTKLSFLVLSAAAMGTFAGTASADQKTYHASFCQAADGLESNYSRSEYRITKTGGSDTTPLLCPIVHDVYDCDGVFGCVKGITVDVRVVDNHNTGDVVCTLSARSSTGGAFWYSTDRTYNRPGTNETLELSGGGQWGDGDNYILKCTMPANDADGYAKIYGYTVNETD